jgi:hypothetical protein
MVANQNYHPDQRAGVDDVARKVVAWAGLVLGYGEFLAVGCGFKGND